MPRFILDLTEGTFIGSRIFDQYRVEFVILNKLFKQDKASSRKVLCSVTSQQLNHAPLGCTPENEADHPNFESAMWIEWKYRSTRDVLRCRKMDYKTRKLVLETDWVYPLFISRHSKKYQVSQPSRCIYKSYNRLLSMNEKRTKTYTFFKFYNL